MAGKERSILGTVIRTLVAYVLIVGLYILTTYLSYLTYSTNLQTAKKVTTQLGKLFTQVLAHGPLAIFFHNLALATMMSLPFIGPGNTVLITVNTGRAAGIIAASTSNVSLSAVGLTMTIVMTTLLPHAILEFLAYAIALENSITLTLKILKFEISRKDLYIYFLKYSLSVVLLLTAAFIEYAFIISLNSI